MGCSMKNPQPQEVILENQRNDINNSVADLYPDSFKAVHRVILTLFGSDYVLNGYLSVNRPNREFKLIAQNDLGGIVFDIHYIENKKQQIQNNLKSIKNEWLVKSLLRDLKNIYLLTSFPSDKMFINQHEDIILSQKQGSLTRELIFKLKKKMRYRLCEIRHLNNREIVYWVNLEYGTKAGASYPEIILIKDKRMKYSLRMKVQYLL